MSADIPLFRKTLVESGLVDAGDFEAVIVSANQTGLPLDEVLVDKGIVPDKYLGQLLADAYGYPYVNMGDKKISDHVLRIIPERVARKMEVVAYDFDEEGRLEVAMRNPKDLELVHLIEKKTGKKVVPHFASYRGIKLGLEHYSRDLEAAIRNIIKESEANTPKKGKKGDEEEGEEEGVAVRVVELVMNYAYQNNASDVHIEPRERVIVVRYRVDGILHDVAEIPRSLMDSFVTRIKILARMRTDEHFAAQDGKFQQIIDGERLDIRVSVLPVVSGEKVVMRLLSEKGKSFDLQSLGFSDYALEVINRHIKKAFGMILATGPTGSGKTTTMYAVLRILNTRDVNIATIEDPIEYGLEGVNQIQVNKKTGLTFAEGLRSIVRQDPDIVMVGEIRDNETAGIAVNAAMTGHLVLSTLHTNDAATTLPRFRDMQIEPFLISSTVNVIIAQRLVRRVCSRCIVSFDVGETELTELHGGDVAHLILGLKKRNKVKLYKGKGCDSCNHTGYRGRIGIYEVLEMQDNIRELIMAGANSKIITERAKQNGMITMFEDGLDKSLQGHTTVEEVIRVTGGVNK